MCVCNACKCRLGLASCRQVLSAMRTCVAREGIGSSEEREIRSVTSVWKRDRSLSENREVLFSAPPVGDV